MSATRKTRNPIEQARSAELWEKIKERSRQHVEEVYTPEQIREQKDKGEWERIEDDPELQNTPDTDFESDEVYEAKYKANAPALLPCPFCGCLAWLYAYSGIFSGIEGSTGYRVECEGMCHAMTCYWHTETQAVDAWNQRHS